MEEHRNTEDAKDARIRVLEAAIDDMTQEARSARRALCDNELQIRLDNIIRRGAAVRR